MNTVLQITVQAELTPLLEKEAALAHTSVSTLANDFIRRQLSQRELFRLNAKAVGYAQKAGYPTEEDFLSAAR